MESQTGTVTATTAGDQLTFAPTGAAQFDTQADLSADGARLEATQVGAQHDFGAGAVDATHTMGLRAM